METEVVIGALFLYIINFIFVLNGIVNLNYRNRNNGGPDQIKASKAQIIVFGIFLAMQTTFYIAMFLNIKN